MLKILGVKIWQNRFKKIIELINIDIIVNVINSIIFKMQKQPLRGFLEKRCSENMLQIYRRIPMPKCDFNKVAKQLYFGMGVLL